MEKRRRTQPQAIPVRWTSPLPATVLWRQTLSRLFQTHRRTCTTVTFLYSGADHQPYRPANA